MAIESPRAVRSLMLSILFRDKVDIIEASSLLLELLSETEIAAKYNLRVDRCSYPIYNSLSASLELVGSEVNLVRTNEPPKIYSLNFMLLPASISKRKPKHKAPTTT
jgi:hypothetical protein